MGTVEELERCLKNYEFEKAFVDVLGWTKLTRSGAQKVPHNSLLPRRWESRPAGALADGPEEILFHFSGVAALGPQAVLYCRNVSGDYPSAWERERAARRISRTNDHPIIIFSSTRDQCQDWWIPICDETGSRTARISIDTPNDVWNFAKALEVLSFTLANPHPSSVKRVMREFADALGCEPELDAAERKALKFTQFGNQVVQEVKAAFYERNRLNSQRLEVIESAQAGDEEALQRFYQMMRYPVYAAALWYFGRRNPVLSEFYDLVGAGYIGAAGGLAFCNRLAAIYPEQPILRAIENEIKRELRRMEPPFRVPGSTQTRLSLLSDMEDAVYNALAQNANREPTGEELLTALGLDDDDRDAFVRCTPGWQWRNRVSWDDPAECERYPQLVLREPNERTHDHFFGEAQTRLERIRPSLRNALLIRFGLDEAGDGEKLTLEEVGRRLGVTRERVRQLERKAIEKAREVDLTEPWPPEKKCKYQKKFWNNSERAEGPKSLALKPWALQPPPPPEKVKKANAYIEFLLNEYGAHYSPDSIYRAMRSYFPKSSLTKAAVQEKHHRHSRAS